MKGILKYTTAGWFVWYTRKKDEITSGYDSIPLHPSEKVDDSFRDKEVEFKIVYYLEAGIEEPFKVAELVKAYPYLKGTMNLCEDIIEKKTGKMTEEEWQAAEKAQTEPKDVVLRYKTSLEAQMLDTQLPQTTSDKWKEYQDWLNEPPEISDEEIEKGAREWYDKEGPYKPSAIALKTWSYAIKWYREQLKQPKKN